MTGVGQGAYAQGKESEMSQVVDRVAQKWNALTPKEQREVRKIANRGRITIADVLEFYKPKSEPTIGIMAISITCSCGDYCENEQGSTMIDISNAGQSVKCISCGKMYSVPERIFKRTIK